MAAVIPVILVTTKWNSKYAYVQLGNTVCTNIPIGGISRDVATRLEKVGVLSGMGESTTFAPISVM